MNTKKTLFVAFLLCMSLSLSSCDQVKALIDSIKSKKAEVKANTAAPAEVKKPEQAVMKENTLAKVGNWTISIEDFNERLGLIKKASPDFDDKSVEAKKYVLEELIQRQLLAKDAKEKAYFDEKELEDAVKEFRQELIIQNAAAKILEGVEFTEDEAKQFYDDNEASMITPDLRRVSEIIVKDEAKAKDIFVKAYEGGDFAQLAKDNSIGKTAAQGGDLGFLDKVSSQEMADAVMSLEKAGDVSSVFKGPEGFYIIKLTDIKKGKKVDFDLIKDQIIQNKTNELRQKVLLEYVNGLKAKADIEINEDLLK